MPDFTFAPNAGRYRDVATGRFIPESTVRAGVDALVRDSAGQMAGLAARYRAGDLPAADWLTAQMREIKDVNLAAAIAARGGRAQMTQSDYGRVGQVVRRQYDYARQMAADVLNGRQRLNGRLDVRAGSYANSARLLYEQLRRAESAARGGHYERNVIHSQESCAGCQAESARGWVPVGSLIPVGSRSPCGPHCLCSIEVASRVPELVA